MRKVPLLLLLLLPSLWLSAQVQWRTTQEIESAFKQEQRPVLVYIYSSWCKVCRMQETSVFNDSLLAKAMNKQLYALRINAEDTAHLSFFGRKYKGANKNHYHEFATYFQPQEATLSFPSFVLLNTRLEPLFRQAGYLSKDELTSLLEKVKARP
jgi:thioredoxin-related protein